MTFAYDNDADVLYITLEQTADSCDYVEGEDGSYILRVNKQTGKIVGCTILFFMDRIGEINIPEIGPIPFDAKMLHAK